ncbi:signal peptidase I [uncultured Maritimibacter sp.]|uniref:signal peptidase I n=1 Tax=uncultured Maritimibacter sp. TaxID=991866 RepID=UPI000B22A507|nr:signal peptidase I [uncultured Maritimibacter sp.]
MRAGAPRSSRMRLPLTTIRRTLTFRGRAGRSEFAVWFAIMMLVAMAGSATDVLVAASGLTWYDYGRLAGVLASLPMTALVLRRLTDAGLPRWLLLAYVLPVLWFALVAVLVLRKARPNPRPVPIALRATAVAMILVTLLPIRYEPFFIPSSSMKPTLLIGDYLFADRLAYGLPCFGLCDGDRLFARAPERGDVILFHHPVTSEDFVKRVIALEGETISVSQGVVSIGGVPLVQIPDGDFSEPVGVSPDAPHPRCANRPGPGEDCLKSRLVERLPGGKSYRILDIGPQALDDTRAYTVPEGHVFVMGDNRDNSADSRLGQAEGGVGMVPMDLIEGRFDRVVFSSTGWLYDPRHWRPERLWMQLE